MSECMFLLLNYVPICWEVPFFFFLIINKAEEPYYVFVVRAKFTPKHVNDKIAVAWMAKLAHFASLSPTRMSLFP